MNPRIALLLLLPALLLIPWASALPGPHTVDVPAEEAPLSPDFQAFTEESAAHGGQGTGREAGAPGLLPPPVDRSHLKGVKVPRSTVKAETTGYEYFLLEEPVSGTVSYPVTYDLRTLGRVSPVKNQGSCGSCWAFASYGSLESTLLPGELPDLSENNLKNTHGFDPAPCAGGNADMSTAYLARWSGPAGEAADPYSASGTSSPAGLPSLEHVQEVLYLPARASSLDNGNIKGALRDSGAVYTSIYWTSGAYNSSSRSYSYSGTSPSNHAVTIVGWDDAYNRNRFSPPAPGDGAFIVKNSWGSSWGSGGYFQVSYYDSRIGGDNAVFTAEDPGNYDRIYQYDTLGWTRSVGLGSDTAWFGNIFTAVSDESVEAVSFYTSQVNSSYQVTVYRDPSSGPLNPSGPVSVVNGFIPAPGYHTMVLPGPVQVLKGETFSAVVKLRTPGYRYPIPVEAPISGYSSRASAGAGQSWVSSDGSTWRDLTTISPNGNACLKAFTRVTGPLPLPVLLPTVPRPPRLPGRG
jgi:C1A family cysteine protease